MKATKKQSAILVVALALIMSTASFGGLASAATAKKAAPQPPAANPSAPVKISPLRTDITIEPGTSKTVTTYISNLSAKPTVYKVVENDFVAGDEKGKPALILDENSYAPTHSLKRFMTPIPDVTVEPGQSKQVDVIITVPKTAQAGGYFGAVRFAPTTGGSDSTVALSGSAASIILLTVPGDLVEALQLTNFDIQQNGGVATNFRTPDDLEVMLRFKNTGNVQVLPFGTVTVSKGKKTLYKYDFNTNTPKDSVLPDSARRWTVPVKGLGKFGKYSIQGNFTYGTKGQTIEIKKTIWIIPTTYIFGGIAAIVALIVIILGIVIFLKSYKRRILRNSNRRY